MILECRQRPWHLLSWLRFFASLGKKNLTTGLLTTLRYHHWSIMSFLPTSSPYPQLLSVVGMSVYMIMELVALVTLYMAGLAWLGLLLLPTTQVQIPLQSIRQATQIVGTVFPSDADTRQFGSSLFVMVLESTCVFDRVEYNRDNEFGQVGTVRGDCFGVCSVRSHNLGYLMTYCLCLSSVFTHKYKQYG